MSLYSYVKKKHTVRRRLMTFISYASIISGSLFLFWSFYPVVSFEVYSRLFIPKKIFTPTAQETTTSLQKANSVLGSSNIFSTNLADYTQAGIWFPSIKQEYAPEISLKEYGLSIPKLGIQSARVLVGGEDLKKGLIHYLPRAMPGEFGNVTIFGHSTLPQLYNVSDYKTIFTYLPSLKSGDSIFLTVNDVDYEYKVFDTFVVSPEQVSVLDQAYDNAYLTLVTCCPPGTYFQRCVAKAKLAKL